MMTLSLTDGAGAPVAIATGSLARGSVIMRAMLADASYGKLDDEEKPHLKARVEMMLRIDSAPKKQPAIEAEALRPHNGVRLSKDTIRKAYYERWVASDRDWRRLVNKSRNPEDSAGLDPAMVLKWHELFFRKSGRAKAAYRELERLWRKGEPLPGFPDTGRTHSLPSGLSYSNLMRPKYKPSAITKRVARIGVGAAHDLLPSVLQTRVGMAPGSFLMFDDIWHDVYCSVLGQFGMRRVLQFHCMELLSALQIGRGMKPEILGDDGKMQRLKEREMLFLFAHVLGNRGFNPTGCTCVMELGTATLPERVIRLLHDFSGGKLKVEMGKTSSHPLASGLYGGRAKGNFKLKAALESSGNLIHNETGDRLLLPAQSGNLARVNEPEDLHGRSKHLDQLQKAALLVPKDKRELIVSQVAPPFALAAEILDLMQERIGDFEDHELEGWEQCGFVAPLFRLSPNEDWKRAEALREYPEPVRTAILQTLRDNPRLSTSRLMTRREVYTERVQPHLTTIPAHLVPELLGMELANERRVAKDGRFHFEDADVSAGEHHYEGIVYDENGTGAALKDGETYATFVSMLDPQWMHVCDARGRYLGKAPRTLVPTRGDAEGFAKACGQRTKAARERLVPVLRAAAPIIRRDTEAAEQATEMLAQLGQQAERTTKRKQQDATALLLARANTVTDDEA